MLENHTDFITDTTAREAGGAGLEYDVLEQGDRQLATEPNRGFTITRLEQDSAHGPQPVEAVLPMAYRNRHKPKDIDRLAIDTVTAALTDGDMELLPIDDRLSIPAGNLTLKLDFPVSASEYEMAVADGRAEAGVFNEVGSAAGTDPNAMSLQELVDPTQKHAIIERAVANRPGYAKGALINDLADLDSVQLSDLRNIIEAYDLTDGGRCVRLLNLSTTPMKEEHLRQAVNALRSAADKSGGGVYDRLRTMAILPQDHRVLRVRVEREDGQIGEVLRGGLQQGASIFLSDRLITNLEDRSPMPAIGPEKTMFESFGLPGESEDGPNSPRKGVGAQDWEPTLAHELEHVALPQKYQRDLPSPAPTLYGRTNTDEHVAEVGGALYMGGTYAAEVPEDQWAAVKEMWDSYRGSVDGVKYEQPIGPHFVQCQELDIAQGPLPMRIRYGAQQVPAEITYHLTSDTPEHLTRTLGSTIITSPEV